MSETPETGQPAVIRAPVVTETKKHNRHSIFTFKERRDLEQYFWTEETIHGIKKAVSFTFGVDERCCLCTPALAHNWWAEDDNEVSLLDIDTRFDYLPKFRYFDMRDPTATDLTLDSEYWRVIIFDPPFFYIPMETLFKAVLYVCEGRVEKTKLLMGFLRREEKALLSVFAPFKLRRTLFPLEYAHVKPNKWTNYRLYSNIDLPGIRRIS